MKMRYPFIAILLLAPLGVHAAAIVGVWEGDTSVNWNDEDNWYLNPGIPGYERPDEGDSVGFGVSPPRNPYMNLAGTYYFQSFLIDVNGPTSLTNVSGAIIQFQNVDEPPTITMNSGATAFAIAPPIVMDASLTITQSSANALTIGGGITGNSNNYSLIKAGTGKLILSGGNGASTFAGGTSVSAGTLAAGATNAFPINSAITVASGAFLDLAAYHNTISSLSGAGSVKSDGGTAILTITNGGSFTGGIVNGTGNGVALTLSGGTLILGAASNTYSGVTILNNAAILQAGATSAFSAGSAVTLNDTSKLNLYNAFNQTIGGLSGDSGTEVTTSNPATLTIKGTGVTHGIYQGVISESLSFVVGGDNITYTQTLTNVNTYTGSTGISANATLALTGSGSIATSNGVTNAGTFNISGVNSSATVASLTGTGAVNLGSKTLIVTNGNSGDISGIISGSGGSLTLLGGTLTLSGANTYTGTTTIASGAILTAGNPGGLSSSSLFDVVGTLNISSSGNTIGSLTGSGTVQASSQTPTLTIRNGNENTFSGVLQNGDGTLALTLDEGMLTLSNTNEYTGNTTINVGGTLKITGALSSSTPVINNGTFDISGISSSQRIASLISSSVATVNLGNKTLVITGGGTFSGTIEGAGGNLTISNNTFTLNTTGSNYTGFTTVSSGGTFTAGATNAFSEFCDFTVTGTLSLGGFSNKIKSLSGAGTGTVTAGSGTPTLTITNGGSFSGTLDATGTLGINLTGGTLTLSAANTYIGATTIASGATIALSGSGAIASSSGVANAGTFSISGVTTGASVVNLTGAGAVTLGSKTLTLTNASGTISGDISGSGLFTLSAGSLILTGTNTYTGLTTISAGTLSLSGGGTIATSSGVANAGTFSISGVTGTSATVTNLTGAGGVTLGSKTLIVTNGSGIISGGIDGNGGSFTLSGGSLTLSGTNTYTGTTTIASGATLTAGAGGALSQYSDFAIAGTLSLNGNDSIVKNITGVGSIKNDNVSSACKLSITNGGSFGGVLSDGVGSSALALELTGGTLTLSNVNTYTGFTAIFGGATLALSGSGRLSSSTALSVSGTFDISGMSGGSTQAVDSLAGAGEVYLGSNTLNVGGTDPQTYSGTIIGTTGGFTYSGSDVLTLSGGSIYTGATLVSSGTLAAGGAGVFAVDSDFTVNSPAILDLAGFSNTINSLSGTGIVDSPVTIATLTLLDGGNFSGDLNGKLAITVADGSLTLSGTNSYTSSTTIASGATITAGSISGLSPGSDFSVEGTVILAGYSNTIKSLSGSGRITNNSSTSGTTTLTVSNGGSFSGGISDTTAANTQPLALTVSGGALTLSGTNTYSGATIISLGATLTAGANSAFSSGSDYTVTGILDLDGNSNTIKSLTGNGTVDIGENGLLIINGGSTTTFSGTMTNSGNGGLTISGGTNLTLSGTSSYTGPTLIEEGTLTISETTALSSSTDVTIEGAGTLDITVAAIGSPFVSANSITNSGILNTAIQINLSDTFTQNSGGTFNISFDNDNKPTDGFVNATEDLTLSGTLNVTNIGISPTSGAYALLTGSELNGDFTTYSSSGFAEDAYFSTSVDTVFMYFSACANTWGVDSGNWGTAENWYSSSCVPGENGNINDTATFANGNGGDVTLASADGDADLPVTLYQLIFNTANAYTIDQYSSASTITLNGENGQGVPQIHVSAGSHTINAPIILDLSSEIRLNDGVSLTFGSATTLTSNSSQILTIAEEGSEPVGTGILKNFGSITPYRLNMNSATLENTTTCVALDEINIIPATNAIVTVKNIGTNAVMGVSGVAGEFIVGGVDGVAIVENSGIGAIFAASGIDSVMTIGPDEGGENSTEITNNGVGAFMGVSGAGGSLYVNGENTTILNSGYSVVFGATDSGGSVEFNGGTLTNESGALVQGGPGGELRISGGTLINDATSTIGDSAENLIFTAGLLNTTGDVAVFDYTQSGTSTLQLNFGLLPVQFGNVEASGIATVGSNLVVDAEGSLFTAGQVIDLVTGEKGRFGTYSDVDFLNFPVGVIPNLFYTPNAVQLTTSATVTSNPLGSVGALPFVFANQTNILLQRSMHSLHGTLRKRSQKEQMAVSYQAEEEFNENSEADLEFVKIAEAPTRTTREQRRLVERVQEEMPNRSRFYFGPIDSFGSFSNQGTSQAGLDFNSIGIYTGIDHAFDNYGLGGNLEYAYTKGRVHQDAGKIKVNQIQATGYASWICPTLNQFAVDALFGYGYEWFSIYRTAGPAVAPVIAKGTPQGMYVDGLVGIEYVFENRQFARVPENFMFTPFFNMQYIWARVGAYDERGTGLYDLHVNSQWAQSLRSTVGTRLEYVVTRENFVFKPELDLAWQYEYLDHSRNVDFSTLNVPTFKSISTPVEGAGRNTVLIGVDFLFTFYKVFELEMSYDFQWNDHYVDNTFYLGIGGNF